MIFILYTGKLFLQINLKWEREMQVCKTVPWRAAGRGGGTAGTKLPWTCWLPRDPRGLRALRTGQNHPAKYFLALYNPLTFGRERKGRV